MNDTQDIDSNNAREKITSFMRKNFPQIQMHGGESDIMEVDLDEGYVHIVLSGACSGCGISPMTTQMIRQRMFKEFEFVNDIDIDIGFDSIHNVTESSINENQSENDADEDTKSNIQAPF